MKRVALAAAVALALACAFAPRVAVPQSKSHATPLDVFSSTVWTKVRPSVPRRCTIDAFRPFSADVWAPERWRRGAPPHKVIRGQRRRLRCASAHHRAAIQRTWQRDKSAYNDHRRAMLHRVRWTPYYGCTKLGICGWWAIPAYIVSCESGGDYGALNLSSGAGGAYQALPSTWAAYGGEGAPHTAPKREQDRVARLIWLDVGEGAWACA